MHVNSPIYHTFSIETNKPDQEQPKGSFLSGVWKFIKWFVIGGEVSSFVPRSKLQKDLTQWLLALLLLGINAMLICAYLK